MTNWLSYWVRLLCLDKIGEAMPTLYERKFCQLILPAVLEDLWRVKADNDN